MVKKDLMPREKLISRGVQNLETDELVQISLGTGYKGFDFVKLSRQVYKKLQKSIDKNEKIRVEDLVKIHGIGVAKASKIVAGIELGRRLYGLFENSRVINSTKEAFQCVSDIAHKKQEYLVALFLNARYEMLGKRTIRIGSLNRLSVSARDIIIPALELNSAGVVLAHNHPSGDFKPSDEDIGLTRKLQKAFDFVGLGLVDHIVVARKGWVSVLEYMDTKDENKL